MEPAISRKNVDRAGEVLRKSTSDEEIREAMRVVSAWRSLHLAPLAAINMLLRQTVRRQWETALVARRMKRMPSIAGKLQRFPDMRVSRMQDIGGARVIVDSVEDVYALYDCLVASKDKYGHELELPPKDYIARPKPDGYRSLHQVFRYSSRENQHLNGLRTELQIRTRLQHAWATAVETLGVLEKTSFKTGEGDESFKHFFSLASALFALHEGQPVPEAYKGVSASQLVREFEEADAKLQVRSKLKALSVQEEGKSQVVTDKKGGMRLLVLQVHETGRGVVMSQNIESPEMAFLLYSSVEQSHKDDPNTIVLLLQIDTMRELRQAYPNYYLDASLFLENIGMICDKYR